MTTAIVRQKMASSVGALEAERRRIEAEIAALSAGLPDEAADVVRRADALMAEHGAKLAELKARRDRIDAQFDVTARDARDLAAQQYRDRREASRRGLAEEEERRLQAVADAEAATRALVDAINRAVAANARLGHLARELTPNGKAPSALNANGLAERFSGRISGLMATVRGHPVRLGFNGVEWKGGSLYPPDRSWVDDEQRRYAADLQPLIQKTGD